MRGPGRIGERAEDGVDGFSEGGGGGDDDDERPTVGPARMDRLPGWRRRRAASEKRIVQKTRRPTRTHTHTQRPDRE